MKAIMGGIGLAIVLSIMPIHREEDTWRAGYTSGFRTAATFKDWDELYEWAKVGAKQEAPNGKHAYSTDVDGGRHEYTDSFAAGLRDARLTIDEEMQFVDLHNSGGPTHFFVMMRDWMKEQPVDKIIPPGHF
jgi:hypothetical protein